ncbi:MAG: hypothetical protein H6658_10055 [Ardenticatenaceae bacterium]|nr:hypothetical protein [Ardenticatenaceae bacterium]
MAMVGAGRRGITSDKINRLVSAPSRPTGKILGEMGGMDRCPFSPDHGPPIPPLPPKTSNNPQTPI